MIYAIKMYVIIQTISFVLWQHVYLFLKFDRSYSGQRLDLLSYVKKEVNRNQLYYLLKAIIIRVDIVSLI